MPSKPARKSGSSSLLNVAVVECFTIATHTLAPLQVLWCFQNSDNLDFLIATLKRRNRRIVPKYIPKLS